MIENLTLRQAVELAVTTEQLGGRFYEKMAHKFTHDKDLASIFDGLSKDEKIHEAQFKALLQDVPSEKGVTLTPEQMHFLKATAISKFFSRNAFTELDGLTKPADVLSAALEFEKSILLYYLTIEEVLGPNPKLGEIIKTEKSHVATLMKVIITDARFRGLGDTW